jgi:RNA polymerase sigma-70 factor (subfamily 1)
MGIVSMSPETESLVRRAQGGDGQAFGQLHARYLPRLERIVRARLGAVLRKRMDAEDILQDVFIDVLQGLGRFEARTDAGLIDWLATLVVNRIRKRAEHWNAQRRSPDQERGLWGASGSAPLLLVAQNSGPVTRAVRNERTDQLEGALDELEEPAREVLILHHMVGMTFEEIAECQGRPSPAAAREFYRRSRAKLALVLRRRGVE